MLNLLRRRSLALAALLLMLGAVSVELCLHDAHAGPLLGATASIACADCADCEGAAPEPSAHGHACLCACHSPGVLVGLQRMHSSADAGDLLPSQAASRPADFRARLERPPLTA